MCALVAACNKSPPPPPAAAPDAASPVAASAPPPAPVPGSLNGFEGEIDATLTDAKTHDAPVALSLVVKDGKVRADIPDRLTKPAGGGGPLGGAGYVIVDPAAKKMDFVSDPRRQVFAFDLDKGSDLLKQMGAGRAGKPSGPPGPPAEQKVTKTGRYSTVAGYRCEDWDLTGDHREGTICVADTAASWLHFPNLTVPSDKAWMGELLDGKHLPLRFTGYAKDGTTEEARFEVTQMNQHPVEASLFDVPPGYTVFDLAKMMQGLKGLPGAPGGPPAPGLPPAPPKP